MRKKTFEQLEHEWESLKWAEYEKSLNEEEDDEKAVKIWSGRAEELVRKTDELDEMTK